MKILKLLITIILFAVTVQAAAAMDYVDLISPKDQAHISTGNLTLDYYPNLEGGIDRCTLEVNGNFPIEDSNVTNSKPNSFKTTTPPEGNYTWRVHCANVNTSVVSESRDLISDSTPPSVSLLIPEDGTFTGENVDLKFKVVDNISTKQYCDVRVDGNIRKNNITVLNNTQKTSTIEDLDDGVHQWNVTCRDKAGNNDSSDTRSFVTEINAEFTASLNKQTYEIGEQVRLSLTAPDGTNLSIEVCPDGDGFVECFESLTLTDGVYPREEILPFTNKSGTFIIDAFFAYKSQTESKQLTYEVDNNLQVQVNGGTQLQTGDTTTLTGSATGGTGAFSYEWKLHNGTTVEGNSVELSFESPGSYDETFTATDEAGNKKTKKVTISVTKAFEITVTVKNSKTNAALKGVSVEIGNEEEFTGEEGKASMKVNQGSQEISAFLSNYELYEGNVNINANKNVNINLVPKTNTTPEVSLQSPQNGENEAPGNISFSFSVSKADALTCTLFIKKGSSANFESRGSVESSEGTQSIQTKLSEGDYEWKVTCEQNGNEYTSQTRNLKIEETNDELTTNDKKELGFDKESMLKDLDEVLETYSSMSSKERGLAEKLGFYDDVKDTVRQVQRAARDIHDLAYRTDMTEEEKEQEKNNKIESVKREYKNTVRDITVKDSKSFVAYPEKEELREVVEAYAKNEGFDGKIDGILNAVHALQGEIVVSTRASTIEVERLDGSKKTITAIVKKIEVGEVEEGSYLIEYIPKSIAENTEELEILGEYEVIEEDPVLKFEMSEEIAYYVNRELDLEETKGVISILARDDLAASMPGVTGSVTFPTPNIDVKSEGFLIIVIILLAGIYFLHDSKWVKELLNSFNKKEREKEIHYLRVLVNDALDNLEADDYDKASLIYREIKLTFDNMDLQSKNEVYDDIMDLVNKLDIAYSRQLSDSIDTAIKRGDYSKARMMYKKLQATYRKLGEDYKKEIYDKITAIAGRLKG